MVPPRSLMESLSLLSREAYCAARSHLLARRGEDDRAAGTCGSSTASPVLVLGGFLSHPYYYAPLGRILSRRGFNVHFDEVFNARPFKAHVSALARRIDTIVQAAGAPLSIVGHSLGGLQGMALLIDRPDAVARVIAVASPVAGGTPWRVLQQFAERVLQVEARECDVLRRRLTSYADRVTTIASPSDPIAPPWACTLDGATNVVLRRLSKDDRRSLSHGGVIFMRAATRIVLETLTRPIMAPSLELSEAV